MTDEELLTMVQEACFRYYWDAAHPVAGMALEVIPGDRNLVALGASGFGVMALVVGVERGFITREQGAERMLKIVRFLDGADRFHGAWPHFLDGRNGKVIPLFGKYDDGGDLVETAFLIQGLLAARQYFDRDLKTEREIREKITGFLEVGRVGLVSERVRQRFPLLALVTRSWLPYLSPADRVERDDDRLPARCCIADSSRSGEHLSHRLGRAVGAAVRYRQGWSGTTHGDHYVNGNTYYGIKLDVGPVSELFFTQFSFLGFDSRHKKDRYANYFENNRNMALDPSRVQRREPSKASGIW